MTWNIFSLKPFWSRFSHDIGEVICMTNYHFYLSLFGYQIECIDITNESIRINDFYIGTTDG